MSNNPSRLQAFFTPQRVAVIGASEQGMYPAGVIQNLRAHGFPGAIYPVNPHRQEVFGLPCYPDLAALPQPPDLAVVVVNRRRVLAAVRQCLEAGVPAAVVFAAGFAEEDAEGRRLQDELHALLASGPLALLGPNCAGLADIPSGLVLTRLFGDLQPGRISFTSQSGALMMAMAGLFNDRSLGLNRLISVGNQVDIDLSETLDFLAGDASTTVIAAFVEGVRDGRRFAAALRRALEAGKPVVLVKSGRTASGQRAAASHTAAVAGSERVFQAVCRQFGAILVDDLRPLLDTVQIFDRFGLPDSRQVRIITQSGGMGSLAADWCEHYHLELPELHAALCQKLAAVPHLAGLRLHNPMDVRGASLEGPATLQTLEPFLNDLRPALTLLLLARTAVQPRDFETAVGIIEATRHDPAPLVVVWAGQVEAGADQPIRSARHVLLEAGIPVFEQVSDALRAISLAVEYVDYRRRWLQAHADGSGEYR